MSALYQDNYCWPRCKTCNRYLPKYYNRYMEMTNPSNPEQEPIEPRVALNRLGILNDCCRTNIISPIVTSCTPATEEFYGSTYIDPGAFAQPVEVMSNVSGVTNSGGITHPVIPAAPTITQPATQPQYRLPHINLKDESLDLGALNTPFPIYYAR